MGSTGRSRDLTCFKCKGVGHFQKDCPNNKVMILTDDGYISASDEDDTTPFADFAEDPTEDERMDCRPGLPDGEHMLVCTPRVH